ncbi:hypothetical protein [Sphingomonas sp. Leaf10]|uniref:hypothetical protein n=1 Tax=Sphingomonas sp. Leaf10 TaxID=1735676 RepID=UPI000AE44670|nr:hypothetical protein [Sphingomonas sp. Leaf10]
MMALGVADGIDLGASTAFGAADAMGQGPLSTACAAWVLMQLLSINSRSSACQRAEDICPNTALGAAHEALCSVFFDPCTSAPSASALHTACTIPLSTWRSSIRALPCTSVGKSGAIRSHWASETGKIPHLTASLLDRKSPSGMEQKMVIASGPKRESRRQSLNFHYSY